MGQKAKKDKASIVPLRDLTEASQVVSKIGGLAAAIEGEVARHNQRVARMQEELAAKIQEHQEEREHLIDQLFAYAVENRASLTRDETVKTVEVPGGKFGFRSKHPSVVVTDEETVIALLKAQKLDSFVRTREEVNREVVLNFPDQVEGVEGIQIRGGENFFVKPDLPDLDLEFTRAIKKPKKKKE